MYVRAVDSLPAGRCVFWIEHNLLFRGMIGPADGSPERSGAWNTSRGIAWNRAGC
jgi:hypothetical protein